MLQDAEVAALLARTHEIVKLTGRILGYMMPSLYLLRRNGWRVSVKKPYVAVPPGRSPIG